MNINEIKSIQFGILNDDDIKAMAVCKIDKTTWAPEFGSVYDPRMGVCESGSLCITCNKDIWKCTGHFGYISLSIPIIIFYKQAVQMLKIFCFKCHKLLVTKKELKLQNIKGYDRIIHHITEKISFCSHCGRAHPKIKFDAQDHIITAVLKHKQRQETMIVNPENIKLIFDNIADEEVSILGVNPKFFHPKNLVLTTFPVIPQCCRPRMITTDNVSDDDLSITLLDIIRINQSLFTNTTNEKFRSLLKFKTLTYCDNSRGKSTHSTNHKPITGIKERINKKTGHIRQNIMGKRCDRTVRTVMGGDPTLKLNEVAVPYEIANIITMQEIVNPINIDKLTELVNTPGKASVIIKKNGPRISVAKASVNTGTILFHGDIITRHGKQIVVTNCKTKLQKDDIITRKMPNLKTVKTIPTVLPEKRHITLEVGDKIERFMQNGDFILLNRQPTLHRNSMQGMKAVLRPGKTMRINLALTPGFNMDFDGDEGNGFVQITLESKAELECISNAIYNVSSFQSNKPDIFIVQDSLLGAYLMTKELINIGKKHFQNCLMRISHNYDYLHRLGQIRKKRNEDDNTYSTHALFGFIFPPDFHYELENGLKIEFGIVTAGYFDKLSLKGTKNSLIRILYMEYNEHITAQFIDNIQFITNAFLEIFPFSIGINDCIIGSEAKKIEIKNTIHKFFLEANNVKSDFAHIRESRVNAALNKAKDIGLKIAKEALHKHNNFIDTVSSGSKGDYFNIAQITGLLGQQNLNSKRPALTINNNKRTLIHYPEVICDTERKYRSRGFVSSSFLEGMYADEMFFHAMTGREGMIKTAMGTATSGYIQRSIVKINEDLKVEYDGTIRDSRKNVYQNTYGGHGFDPSKITIDEKKNEVYPVDFKRLAYRLNNGTLDNSQQCNPLFLSDEEIDEIVEKCKVILPTKMTCMNKQTQQRQDFIIRNELSKIKICPCKFSEFKNYIVTKYNTSRATPGECVGIICAQSIGERQTQSTLDTFHTAGKLVTNGIERLEEILNMSKKLKVKTCNVYFKNKYTSAEELRTAIGTSIVCIKFKSVYETMYFEMDVFKVTLNLQALFQHRIDPVYICNALVKAFPQLITNVFFTSTTLDIHIDSQYIKSIHPTNIYIQEICSDFDNLIIAGIVGIERIFFDFDHSSNEWYIITKGSNLKKLLVHPLVNVKKLYCNDLWEVYEVLGLVGLRKYLLTDLKKVITGVNSIHIALLVDKMTFKGKPSSITRYTMRNNEVGPISKATFEEPTDILINAAMRTEIETMQGVSAAIIGGNQAPVGTGFFGLQLDYKKLLTFEDNTFKNDIKYLTINEQEEYIPKSLW